MRNKETLRIKEQRSVIVILRYSSHEKGQLFGRMVMDLKKSLFDKNISSEF